MKHILYKENKNDRYKSEEQSMEVFLVLSHWYLSLQRWRESASQFIFWDVLSPWPSLCKRLSEKNSSICSVVFFSFWQLFRLTLLYSFIWIACHWCSFYRRLVLLHREIIMRSGCESTYLPWRLFEWFRGIILMSCALQGWAYLTGVSHMKLQRTFSLPVNKRHPCS